MVATVAVWFNEGTESASRLLIKSASIVQILNVPQRARLRSSLAAALLDGLSEQPAKISERVWDV
jgi:hypothetical protein